MMKPIHGLPDMPRDLVGCQRERRLGRGRR
jgi:hypothetical protein